MFDKCAAKSLNQLLRVDRIVGGGCLVDELVESVGDLALEDALHALGLGVLAAVASVAEPRVHLLDADSASLGHALLLFDRRIRIVDVVVEPLVHHVDGLIGQLMLARVLVVIGGQFGLAFVLLLGLTWSSGGRCSRLWRLHGVIVESL